VTQESGHPFDEGPYAGIQEQLALGRPGDRRVRRRMIVAGAVAFVPLVALSAAQGLLIGPTMASSFLYDIPSITRYLIVLPILIGAERSYLPRLGGIVREFAETGLIRPAQQANYAELINSTRALVRSRVAALVIIALAYVATLVVFPHLHATTESTWIAPITGEGRHYSWAGWWRMLVSQPLFLIVVSAFLWRLALWTRFLAKVSRMDLRLLASHPDHHGGLGFIPASVRVFPPIGFVVGAIAASNVAMWIAYYGHPAVEVEYAMFLAVLVVLALIALPLLVFSPMLFRLRTEGIYRYGRLMHDVGVQFEDRWLDRRPAGADPVGSADFSSMIDLSAVVDNVHSIRPVLIDVPAFVPLVVSALVPFIPVAFLVMSVKDIIQGLVSLLF
jgi:hypothetical protein